MYALNFLALTKDDLGILQAEQERTSAFSWGEPLGFMPGTPVDMIFEAPPCAGYARPLPPRVDEVPRLVGSAPWPTAKIL